MNDLTLSIAGQTIPFRHFESAKGNHCWAVLKKGKLSSYGVKIAALATELPKSAQIVGASGDPTVLTLKSGITQSGNNKTSFYGQETLPNGERRMVTINVSLCQDGNWNLIAKAIPSAASGGNVLSLTDL